MCRWVFCWESFSVGGVSSAARVEGEGSVEGDSILVISSDGGSLGGAD